MAKDLFQWLLQDLPESFPLPDASPTDTSFPVTCFTTLSAPNLSGNAERHLWPVLWPPPSSEMVSTPHAIRICLGILSPGAGFPASCKSHRHHARTLDPADSRTHSPREGSRAACPGHRGQSMTRPAWWGGASRSPVETRRPSGVDAWRRLRVWVKWQD